MSDCPLTLTPGSITKISEIVRLTIVNFINIIDRFLN